MFLFHKINKFQKILKFVAGHKVIAVIIVVALISGGYFGYKAIFPKKNTTRYVVAAVEKGTLIVSISGSGQVAASDQVDVKSKVSGDVVYVGAKKGQSIKAGALLAQLDASDVQKTVRDAEINLEKANLALEKMQGTITEEGALRGLKEKAQDDLKKAYDDGFNTVANAFLSLPTVMTGLHNILFSFNFTINQWNIDYYADTVKDYDGSIVQYRNDAYDKYQIALRAYDKNFKDYKSTNRFSEASVIDSLISETYDTVKNLAEAIKNATNLIQLYQNKIRDLKQALSDTHLSSLASYTGTTNSFLLSILSIKNTIQADKESVINTAFDIADQEIKIEEAQNTLSDAKEKLADYYIRAPFDGIVASIDIKKGDSISSSTVATLITKQKIAEITLNEVDIAKIKTGQKANITFDAVEDLNITGEVAEVDALGTTTQGVITYGVKITFDTQDERVKPGMSVSTAIITDVKQDTLLVSGSAIKQQGDISYVEIMTESGALQQQVVTTGLSNDTMTEILSGLQEGDKIVTTQKTTTKTSAQSKTRNGGEFMIPGMDR